MYLFLHQTIPVMFPYQWQKHAKRQTNHSSIFKFLLGSDLLTFYWPKENHMSKFKVSSEAECSTRKSKAMKFYEKGHGDREKWSKATAEVSLPSYRMAEKENVGLAPGGPVWYLGVSQKWLVFTLSLSQRWLEGLVIGKKSSWQTQLQIVYLVIHGNGQRCGLS